MNFKLHEPLSAAEARELAAQSEVFVAAKNKQLKWTRGSIVANLVNGACIVLMSAYDANIMQQAVFAATEIFFTAPILTYDYSRYVDYATLAPPSQDFKQAFKKGSVRALMFVAAVNEPPSI